MGNPTADIDVKSTPSEEGHAHDVREGSQRQELDRNFSLLSICSVGIVTGNSWAALGGSIAVAIYNGGPPGVIYEFITVTLFYWLIAASLAELASAIPSSAGVYHWASITPGPKYGRICGWFAGWWNYFAWNFGSASMAAIVSQICVQMYATYHPTYGYERWHGFIAYIIATWACCCTVLFANSLLPAVSKLGLFFIIAGVLISILVCAIMPSTTGSGHASHQFVWSDWTNDTGYSSNGFVFLAGMLNGAYAIGTPDCVSHLAEEIPSPKRNIPLAISAQMAIGLVSALVYIIALFYGITDMGAVLDAPIFPLATIYAQATSSQGATLGLLLTIFFPIFCTCIGTYITAGRTLWTLARDDATPFSSFLGKISATHKNPFNATVCCGVVSTVMGLIWLGSPTAFNAFVGSFVLLSTFSYLAAILPFLVTGRFSRSDGSNTILPGPFRMPQVVGYVVNAVSCVYIIVFGVIYCFPYSMPVTAEIMNYSSLITGGLTIIVGLWWLVHQKKYKGPKTVPGYDD